MAIPWSERDAAKRAGLGCIYVALIPEDSGIGMVSTSQYSSQASLRSMVDPRCKELLKEVADSMSMSRRRKPTSKREHSQRCEAWLHMCHPGLARSYTVHVHSRFQVWELNRAPKSSD